MHYFSIDALLFSLFLILNLGVGLFYGKKVKTLREYAVGDKKFGTLTIAATIVATWTTGSGFSIFVSGIYSRGLTMILMMFSSVITFYFVGKIAARVGEFLNDLSVAEAIGSLYGPTVRLITALSGIIKSIGFVAVQFKASAVLLELLFGFEGTHATYLAAFIVILYSSFGGIKSVTFTDIVQFLVFGLFIPILALIIWRELKNPEDVIVTLKENPIFSFKELFTNPIALAICMGQIFFNVASGLKPAMFQRIVLARDVLQVRKAFNYAALVQIVIGFFFTWISILLVTADPNVPPEQLVHHLIEKYTYTGFKGFMAIGIMSMAMSTVDSCMNSAAVLFAHDLVKPLKIPIKNSLLAARLFSFVIGGGALFLALSDYDLLGLIYLSGNFYMPVVLPALTLAIFGFRSSTKAVLIGIVAGLVTVVIWRLFFLDTGIDSIMPATLANFVFFLGSHYLLNQPGGWVGVKDNGPLIAEKYRNERSWRLFLASVKNFSPSLYLSRHLPVKETSYILFGLYVMGAVYLSFYTIPKSIMDQFSGFFLPFAFSLLLVNSIFLTYPLWTKSIKKTMIIAPLWAFGFFYLLFFGTTVLMILNQFHFMHVMLFMTNLTLATWLIHWPFLLLLSGLGISLAIYFVHNILGQVIHLSSLGFPQYVIIYGAGLFSFCLILLAYQKLEKKKLADRSLTLEELHHTTKIALIKLKTAPERFVRHLNRSSHDIFETAYERTIGLQKRIMQTALPEVEKESINREVGTLIAQIKDSAVHLEKVIDLIENEQTLQQSSMRLKDFIDKLVDRAGSLPDPVRLACINLSSVEDFQIDFSRVYDFFLETLTHMKHYNPNSFDFFLHVQDTQLTYPSTHDTTYALPGIAFFFTTEVNTPLIDVSYPCSDAAIPFPDLESDWYATQAANILYSHYGYVDVEKAPQSYFFVVPVDVSHIRPNLVEDTKGNRFSKESLEKTFREELAFWETVNRTNQYDLLAIKSAVELMKSSHKDQGRLTEEPFYIHPLIVARYVCEANGTQEALLAALLHDTVEDTNTSPEEIGKEFGPRVKELVIRLSHMAVGFKKYNLKVDHDKTQALDSCGDKEAVLIKLCDQLHNMETLQTVPSQKREQKICRCMAIYVPLARKYGFDVLADRVIEVCKQYDDGTQDAAFRNG